MSFWSFSNFLHHGMENVGRNLLGKFCKTVQRKSWSNMPSKLLDCIRFLHKAVHKSGRLRMFNRAPEIEFNFLPLGLSLLVVSLVHYSHGSKLLLKFGAMTIMKLISNIPCSSNTHTCTVSHCLSLSLSLSLSLTLSLSLSPLQNVKMSSIPLFQIEGNLHIPLSTITCAVVPSSIFWKTWIALA